MKKIMVFFWDVKLWVGVFLSSFFVTDLLSGDLGYRKVVIREVV